MSSQDATKFGRIIAHSRIFTDIPFAKEIARLANTKSDFLEAEKSRDDIPELTARYEVRFKSVSAVAIDSGSNRILELAAGLSGRGLDLTSDPTKIYVETDLPDVISNKRPILEQLVRDLRINRPNLHLRSIDVLNYDDLLQNAERLSAPLTVICEGLLSNLNFSALRAAVSNIQRLLSEFGGIFITPDFANAQTRTQSMAKGSDAHTFESDERIFEFINESGFKFERFSQNKFIDEISCSLNFDRKKLLHQIENLYVYRLTVKD